MGGQLSGGRKAVKAWMIWVILFILPMLFYPWAITSSWAGTIDLLVSKRVQDTPIVAVSEIDHSLGSGGIVATEDIKTAGDLKGKKVAFTRDDVSETFISYLFYKKGMSLDDITIAPRRPDDAWLAFLNGEVDAAVTWEPWLSTAAQRPGGHILISTREEPHIIIDTLNGRIPRKPNAAGAIDRKLLEALYEDSK